MGQSYILFSEFKKNWWGKAKYWWESYCL